MSLHDFWHNSADLFFAYREAYMMKEKRDIELHNEKAWLSGLYVLSALWEVESHINTTKEDKHLASKYFPKPIDLNATEDKDTINDKIKERVESEENKIKLMVAQSKLALQKKKQKENKE